MKYLILVFLLSCAQKPVDYDIQSVSLNSDGVDSIEIDNSTQVNPEKSTETNIKDETKKMPKINLSIYSTIYHSLALLELIKKLEKKEIPIYSISSQGFGSILAALYAKEQSASYLEWKLFDLLKRLKGKKVYSKAWRNEINNFISKEFQNSKITDLKVKLIIPFLVDKNVKINKDLLVKDVLKFSSNLNSSKNYLNYPQPYGDLVKVIGSDVSFEIAYLPKSIQFKVLNGFEYGVYTSYLGEIMKPEYGLTIFRSNQVGSLDELQSIADISNQYVSLTEDFISEIEKSIEAWREESTSGLLSY